MMEIDYIGELRAVEREIALECSLDLYRALLGDDMVAMEGFSIGNLIRQFLEWLKRMIDNLKRFFGEKFRRAPNGLVRNYKLEAILVRTLQQSNSIMMTLDATKPDFLEKATALANLWDKTFDIMLGTLMTCNSDDFYKKIPLSPDCDKTINVLLSLKREVEALQNTNSQLQSSEQFKRSLFQLGRAMASLAECVEMTQKAARDKYLTMEVNNVTASRF